ncbi:hypothetical protein KSS87_012035 [Heliosperma pusillum]|nr:hypothetical protein KSS87_012035 [Heliosperma pusillum]
MQEDLPNLVTTSKLPGNYHFQHPNFNFTTSFSPITLFHLPILVLSYSFISSKQDISSLMSSSVYTFRVKQQNHFSNYLSAIN